MSSLSYYDAMELPPGTPPRVGDRYVIDTDDGQKMAVIKNYNDEDLPPNTQFVFSTTADGRQQLFALVPTNEDVEETTKRMTSERAEGAAGTSRGSGEEVDKDMPHLEIEREELIVDDYDSAEAAIHNEYISDGDEKPQMTVMRGDVEKGVRTGRLSMPSLPRPLVLPHTRSTAALSAELSPLLTRNSMGESTTDLNDLRFCPGCRMSLKRSVYYHHTRMIRKYGICNMFTPKRFPCTHQECPERLGTLEALCNHMFQQHGAPTNIQTKICRNEAEFNAFLTELEGKGGNFRMSRGGKTIKHGVVQYFRCNRLQSLPKDKTRRLFDDFEGMSEPIDYELYLEGEKKAKENPFENDLANGGKHILRTEQACTAFYRKVYMQDGSIEVRYCDYHLHEDEKLRLPAVVKQRIEEMYDKKLPIAVIILVLKEEVHRYCSPESAIERKILSLSSRDISNAVSNVMKQRLKHGRLGQIPEQPEEMTAEMIRESVRQVEIGQLTEIEQKMLELYEANHEVILDDMMKIRRDENRKRCLRENIKNKLFALGRFIKTSGFLEMNTSDLTRVHDILDTINFVMEESSLPAERIDIKAVKMEPNEVLEEQREGPQEMLLLRRHNNSSLSDEDEIVDVQEVDMHNEVIINTAGETRDQQRERVLATEERREQVRHMEEEMIVGHEQQEEEEEQRETTRAADTTEEEAIETAKSMPNTAAKEEVQHKKTGRRGRPPKRTSTSDTAPAANVPAHNERRPPLPSSAASTKSFTPSSPSKKRTRRDTELQEEEELQSALSPLPPSTTTRTGRLIKPRLIRDM